MTLRIINNNLWSPIPWGWNSNHHCCNYNNGLSKMMGWAMMFSMVDSMFNRNKYMMPMQSSWYPYVNFSTTQADTQDSQDNSLKGVKDMYGEYFNISKIGEKYYAVSKDCKTQISGETPNELLEKIGEHINNNPDTYKGESKSENSGKLEVDYGDKPTPAATQTDGKPSDGTSTDEATDDNPPPAGKTHQARKSPKGWYPAKADKQNKMHFTKESIEKDKGNDSAAVYVAKQVIKSKGNNFAWIDANKLAEEIIKKNPSVFKDDGSIKPDANLDNLDLPSAKTLGDNKNQLKKAETVSDKKQKACNNQNSRIASLKKIPIGTTQEKDQLNWTKDNYVTSTNSHAKNASSIGDSDAILHIGNSNFNIHCGINVVDFYSLTGRSSNPINNYKLIDSKGHFDPNNKYEYYLTDTSGNKTGHTMKSETHKGKNYFVLICGENRFSMDDIMAGNVPWDQVNEKENNEYALWRNK